MQKDEVKIEDFILRLPGHSKGEAQRLGADVMRRVADKLPPQQKDRRLGAIELKIPVTTGATRERLVTMISDAILRVLK